MAFMGSTPEARQAGRAQASVATSDNTNVAARSRRGSRELSAAQLAITLLRARVRTTPARIPPPTLNTVELKTMRRTWARLAPRAMRIPNSLVRWATVYETTLNSPTAES